VSVDDASIRYRNTRTPPALAHQLNVGMGDAHLLVARGGGGDAREAVKAGTRGGEAGAQCVNELKQIGMGLTPVTRLEKKTASFPPRPTRQGGQDAPELAGGDPPLSSKEGAPTTRFHLRRALGTARIPRS